MQSLDGIRKRREASRWTRIHPIFALGQLGVFLGSVALLGFYFFGTLPFTAVFVSVLVKIVFMIGAIITGSLWERDVFGKWWFADDFFIEDVMTVNVFLLHVGFLVVALVWPWKTGAILAMLSLAYLVYSVNVVQYVVRHHGMRERASESTPEEVAA